MAEEEPPWRGDGGDGGYSPSLREDDEAAALRFVEDGVAIPYNLTVDVEFWRHQPVLPGCILEIPVTRETAEGPEDAFMAIFVMATNYEPTGCWIRGRFLGGSTEWARAQGIRVVSRERQPLHLCCGGREKCKELKKKGQHISVFGMFAPGEGCPDYVEKAKKREWKKLHHEVMAFPPGGARSAGGAAKEGPAEKDPDQLDRISALKKRLQARTGLGEKDTPRASRGLSPPTWMPVGTYKQLSHLVNG